MAAGAPVLWIMSIWLLLDMTGKGARPDVQRIVQVFRMPDGLPHAGAFLLTEDGGGQAGELVQQLFIGGAVGGAPVPRTAAPCRLWW